jgi:hypothetical protein
MHIGEPGASARQRAVSLGEADESSTLRSAAGVMPRCARELKSWQRTDQTKKDTGAQIRLRIWSQSSSGDLAASQRRPSLSRIPASVLRARPPTAARRERLRPHMPADNLDAGQDGQRCRSSSAR